MILTITHSVGQACTPSTIGLDKQLSGVVSTLSPSDNTTSTNVSRSILTLLGIGGIYSTVVALALIKTPFMWELGNRAIQGIGLVPAPKVTLDFNANNLSNSRDQYILDELIWGKNLDPEDLHQGNRPNCQVMGAIQSKLMTDKGLEELKKRIEVANYNLDVDNFFIDTTVHLANNKSIYVSYDELVKWMSPRGINPSKTADGSLAIPILTYALEKELTDNYEGVPPSIPSSVPNLLNDKNYSSVAISPFIIKTLPDAELLKILSEAPETPIFVSSFAKFVDIREWLSRERKEEFEFLPVSQEKENNFKLSTVSRVKQIIEESPPEYSILPPSFEAPSGDLIIASLGPQSAKATSQSDHFPENHFYVVKGLDNKTGKILVTDSHGVKYKPLTLAEFKDKMTFITMPTKDIPIFTKETLFAYFLLLSTISGHFIYKKCK